MKRFSLRDDGYLAYSLGFLTHYATDTVYHPFVYERTGGSLLKHTRLEHALDGYYRRKYPVERYANEKFPREKLSESEKNLLFSLYATITNDAGFPPLEKTEFFRSLNSFTATLPTAFRFFYGFSKDKPFRYTDFADELFTKACEVSDAQIQRFLTSLSTHAPLPYEHFGKSHLTGK